MKRTWNWRLWVGFLFVVAGLFSYLFFSQFPITRDFPWANLLLFGVGAVLIASGLSRAFSAPERHRGKIFGPILATLGLLTFTVFAYGIFYVARHLPSSAEAPRVGQKAPDFTLPDQNGKPVSLRDLLASAANGPGAGGNAALLIFYRGHW